MRWPHVQAVAPLVQSEAMVQTRGELAAVVMQGIDPDHFPAHDLLRSSLKMPGWINCKRGNLTSSRRTAGAPAGCATRGSGYALSPAKAAGLLLWGAPQEIALVQRGRYLRGAGADVDDQLLFTHMEDARRLLRYPAGTVSGLRLWLDDAFNIDALPKASSLGQDLVLQDWRRERGELFQAVAMEKHVMSLMLVLIVCCGGGIQYSLCAGDGGSG